MVEILWNSNAPHSPVKDHDLVELRMVDLGATAQCRYLVREIRASWSAAAQQIRWNGYDDNTYATPQEAQQSFTSRRARLKQKYPYTTVLAYHDTPAEW